MNDLVLICCRCGHSIRPGEKHDEHIHDRASGAPLVNYSHRGGCPSR